jgi:hypothetical protein
MFAVVPGVGVAAEVCAKAGNATADISAAIAVAATTRLV